MRNDSANQDKTTATACSDEAAWVAAAAAGDRSAFAHLYRRHAGWLLPVLWRISGGDRGLAEDWLQDSFVQAWRCLDQLRDRDAFGGWLKRMAINVALSDRRRGKLTIVEPHPGVEDPAALQPPWPAADLDLERAIAGLPKRARQVLVLFHLSGLPHAEIAALMDIDIGTSKAQLHRARTLLKEKLA